ncbi:hypothetical protein J3R30DRAFT_3400997 [Lentinula aciculospora]|uniref:Uncharacterized protein n=1 Tax=Lentinula aciculospora TaxID=153920 RepID=A0A9W9AQQ0_9AGAR|nr:hypothetical protein J3R30DRAFT_3400276 [Lentinula aciculospora]KAJ4488516.1 hypothetical protein J3R30DRAFT_3400997 [Lentinula aciculospora]
MFMLNFVKMHQPTISSRQLNTYRKIRQFQSPGSIFQTTVSTTTLAHRIIYKSAWFLTYGRGRFKPYNPNCEQAICVVKQVAQFECQLSPLNFDTIGSLEYNEKSTLRKPDLLYRRRSWLSSMNNVDSVPKIQDIDLEARSDHAHFTVWYTMLEANLNHLDLSSVDPPRYHFVLLHADLNIGNVLVEYEDLTKVVAVID